MAAFVISVIVSLSLPYVYLVYSSIGMGLLVSALLTLSVYLSYGINRHSSVFVVGISLMVVALLNSDLPTRAVFENLRHASLMLSLVLGGLYTSIALSKRLDKLIPKEIISRLDRPELKPYSDFASMFCTTLSSELCSCLHPVLVFDMLGISLLLPTQVKSGFVLMVVTLAHQLRVTWLLLRPRLRTNSISITTWKLTSLRTGEGRRRYAQSS